MRKTSKTRTMGPETPDVDVVAEVGDIVAVTYANLEADLPEASINLRAVEHR